MRRTVLLLVLGMTPNYALERAGMGRGWRAAGARRDCTPAARRYGSARPAQRGR